MRFEDFESLSRELYAEIPEVYLEGIDGLTVRREAPEHPDHPGVYTLGECLTEEHISDYGSSDTTRSVIALYWGSFKALSEKSESFEWEEEAWETLTHELRHHLESLAGDDALEGVDYAADQSFKRFDGEAFDPWYYQQGDEVEPGVYQVEKAWFVERVLGPAEMTGGETLDFQWRGRGYRIPMPTNPADVHFVYLEGLGEGEEVVELVIVRRRGWWESFRGLFVSTDPVVEEWEVEPEPLSTSG